MFSFSLHILALKLNLFFDTVDIVICCFVFVSTSNRHHKPIQQATSTNNTSNNISTALSILLCIKSTTFKLLNYQFSLSASFGFSLKLKFLFSTVALSQLVRLSICYSCTKCALLSQSVVANTLASCLSEKPTTAPLLSVHISSRHRDSCSTHAYIKRD